MVRGQESVRRKAYENGKSSREARSGGISGQDVLDFKDKGIIIFFGRCGCRKTAKGV